MSMYLRQAWRDPRLVYTPGICPTLAAVSTLPASRRHAVVSRRRASAGRRSCGSATTAGRGSGSRTRSSATRSAPRSTRSASRTDCSASTPPGTSRTALPSPGTSDTIGHFWATPGTSGTSSSEYQPTATLPLHLDSRDRTFAPRTSVPSRIFALGHLPPPENTVADICPFGYRLKFRLKGYCLVLRLGLLVL